MSWNLTRAKYIEKDDNVYEYTIKSGMNYETALLELNKQKDQPVYIWEDHCTEIENPKFAMMETDNYKKEYCKIINL